MNIWKQTSKNLHISSVIFKMFKVGFKSEDSGKEGIFDVLETRNWANIVPITDDGQVIMVKQFRFGSAELSLEFPAGVIEDGEDPKLAAIRELKEETGSLAREVKQIGVCRPNPAFMNNYMYHFAALGVTTELEQDLDQFEEIEIVKLTHKMVDEKIQSGEISHALSVVAWHYYQQDR